MSSWRSKQGGTLVNQGGRWGGRRGQLWEPESDIDELRSNALFVGSGSGGSGIRNAANDLSSFWRGRHNGRASVNAGARDAAMPNAGRWGGRSRLAMDAEEPERIRFKSTEAKTPAQKRREAEERAWLEQQKQQPDKIADDIDPSKILELWRRPGTIGEKSAARAAYIRATGVDPESLSQQTSSYSYSQPQPSKSKSQAPRRYKVTLQYIHNGKTLYYEDTVTAKDEIDAERIVRENGRSNWRLVVGGTAPEFRAYKTQRV